MGNRPTDWNTIGLSTDPTPGDPVRLRALVDSMDSLGRVAREIDDALRSVLDKTGHGAFVGQTADALRDKISGPLREFVQSIADAFENSAKSMRTYVDMMETQQRIADTALTNGRGLTAEDPHRAEFASTARNAGTAQRTQAETTAKVVNTAAAGIKQPVSNCDLFWEAFNWLAIILILPALLLGGPLALLAIGINLVLFVKTAVDVAQGKAGLLDLFLAGLGMIAPTTKGLNLLKLFKDGAKFLWGGLKKFGENALKFLKGTFNAGAFRSFAFIPGMKDFARLAGNWIKVGALWVGGAALKFPSWAGATLRAGGLAVVNGFKAMPALFRGLPGLVKGWAGSAWKFTKAELGGTKWLRLILPVDAAEISRFGLKRALQIGFYERGVLGRFRYGAPLAAAGGRGLSHIPHPPSLHVNALTDMPMADLSRIRIGEWAGAGPGGVHLDHLAPPINLTVTSPAGLHIPTSFGEVMHFAPDAVRRMDALLDLGQREMKLMQIGDWAKLPSPALAGRADHLTGAGSIGQLLPTNAPATGLHGLPTTTTLPSVTHTPSLTSLSALDLVQNGVTHRPNTPSSLLTGGGPGGGTGLGHLTGPAPTNHGLTAPTLPTSGLTNHGLTGPGLPASGLTNHGVTAPGLPAAGSTAAPHVPLRPTEFGAPSNLHAPTPAALAGGPAPTALVPDHAGNALNLLDHGRGTPLRLPESPTNAGALPPVPPPHGPGGGAELRPGTQAGNPLAVAPTPPPAGAGLVGPGNRLTPTQIEQLWQRDSNRVAALFGTAEDPLRAGRIEAWRDLASARNELGRAQQVLHDLEIRPGGPSKPSLFERDARLAVDHASTKVENALTRLDQLGVDPARIDRGIAQIQAQSLVERPRLIGGSTHGTNGLPGTPITPIAPVALVEHVTTAPIPDVTVHAAPGTTGLDGLTVRSTLTDTGHRQHVVLRADGTPHPTLTVEPRGHQGFDLRHPDGSTHGFGPDGQLLESYVPLPGQSAGLTVLTEYHGSGSPTHTLLDAHAAPIADRTFTRLDDGYRITDPATGRSIRYDGNGNIVEQGIALRGTGEPHFIVDRDTGPTLTDVHGNPVTGVDVHIVRGGYRVTEPGSGQTTRYRGTGAIAEHGVALGGPGLPLVVVHSDVRPPLLTNTHGKPITDRTLTTLDHGYRVTDPATGHSIRYAGNGAVVEHGLALGGSGEAHFVVTRDTVPTLTDAHGAPVAGVDVTAVNGGGYRVTEPISGESTRYRGNGTIAEHGIALGGPGEGHFVVHRDGRPPVLTDVHGKPITDRTLTTLDHGFRVTDPAGGHSLRYAGNGALVERGLALHELGEARFIVAGDTGHLVTDVHGVPVAGVEVTVVHGGGYRITEPITGHSTRYTAAGWVAEHGVALGGPGEARFLVGEGAHRNLTDVHGNPVGDHTLTTVENGFRVTDPASGHSVRYDTTTGTFEHGTLLGGAGEPHFVVGGDAGHILTDLHGTPVAGVEVSAVAGGGYRVTEPVGGHSTRYLADGSIAEHGLALGGPGEARFVVGTGADRTLTDINGIRVTDRELTTVENGFRVTDPASGHSVRYDAGTGAVEHGTVLGGSARTRFLEGGVLTDVHGTPIPNHTVTPILAADGAHTGHRVEVVHPNTPRHGEFHEYRPNGTLTREGFNVLDDGRRTPHQYVVDHTTRTPTWRQEFHPDSPGTAFTRNGFQHGTADVHGAGNGRLQLKSATPGRVVVFERRLLPGGHTLDAFRRTDLSGFGAFSHRTKWVEWGVDGAPVGSGSRRFDTSGFAWTDVDAHFTPVREFRDSLQKFDGRAGHTLGVKGTDGWTWHRYDDTGHELAGGPRTPHRDGGWTDRHGPTAGGQAGELVQKQWGPMHRTDHARHYLEHPLDNAGLRRPAWDEQSPQGKETGKHEVRPDGSTFTTNRISEQRPPQWARKWLSDHRVEPTGAHSFLSSDTRYQVFTWQKSVLDADGNLVPHSGGIRFVGDDGGFVDILADGGFARAQSKLHSGSTLKVGDSVTPHASAPAGSTPWSEGNVIGYRAHTPDGPGGAIWQDRRPVLGADGTTRWEVVREGFPNGNVREYAHPQPAHPGPNGELIANPNSAWVERDAHGYLTGRRDTWTSGQDPAATIIATGPSSAKTWQWERVDAAGEVQESGKRVLFRSSDDPRLPFDDSFRDFDRAGDLVRERRMLDDGRYVDSWKVPGTDTWTWQKYDRAGQIMPHPGAGTRERLWWNPRENHGAGAWQANPVDGKNLLFRDRFVPATGEAVVVRETPPHIGDAAPARVREYGTDATGPNSLTWKEFDHGSTVRTRARTPEGHYLETDAWRGQWRQYDADGRLVARRTDGGAVITTDSLGRWRVIGSEYDFRGQVTEMRGWVRRIREGQRMPWTGSMTGIDATQFRSALTGLPGIPTTGAIHLSEAAYQSYGTSVLAKKLAVEFAQEFAIEFTANIIVADINARAQGKSLSDTDWGKAALNAAVGGVIKGGVGAFVHENKYDGFRRLGNYKSGYGNIDGGKHWNRRPNNHDKTWANEWAGNETAIRWRSGTYDFGYSAGVGLLAGLVNGSINASVFGVKGADGLTHKLSGWAALGDGAIASLSGVISTGSVSLARIGFLSGAGGRFFHRQGAAEFLLNIGFKIGEKLFNGWLLPKVRAGIDPFWYSGGGSGTGR
ncbi:hypothetical protein [Embleya sp. AB8]|uniref:hypothetical protein n=1 Tax=Embleya sp. AB8 TaxID=3156304 RepID=UPI003C71A015